MFQILASADVCALCVLLYYYCICSAAAAAALTRSINVLEEECEKSRDHDIVEYLTRCGDMSNKGRINEADHPR